jgi:ADP-ribose pyrophosphatase
MNSYLDTLPNHLAYLGSAEKGEITIDRSRANDVGFGVLYEDKYIRLVKDPVVFPNESMGGYVRILNSTESNHTGGAVIIPIIGEQVAFVRVFRHATRSWEIELPRGFQDPHISESENARKEIQEELGVDVLVLSRIGIIKPNTGLLSSTIAVFVATLANDPEIDAVDSIEIHSRVLVPRNDIDDFMRTTPVTCSISLSALCLARLHGVLT